MDPETSRSMLDGKCVLGVTGRLRSAPSLQATEGLPGIEKLPQAVAQLQPKDESSRLLKNLLKGFGWLCAWVLVGLWLYLEVLGGCQMLLCFVTLLLVTAVFSWFFWVGVGWLWVGLLNVAFGWVYFLWWRWLLWLLAGLWVGVGGFVVELVGPGRSIQPIPKPRMGGPGF